MRHAAPAFDPGQTARGRGRYAGGMKPWQKDQLRRALEQRRDVAELRDIEAARCIECQRRHEKTYRD